MQCPVRSSPVSGDGIHRSRCDDSDSNRSDSQKHMTYDWTVFQTLLFIFAPFFLMLAMIEKDDDDTDGPDGGLMQPAWNPQG